MMACPRCGGTDLRRCGSILLARGMRRAQRWECKSCRKRFHEAPQASLREAYLDIEASQLNATFGYVISWALKIRGDPNVRHAIIKSRSLRSEKRVLRDLLRALKDVDVVYTYYGSRFDIPFIRARCLYHSLEFPSYLEKYHRDVYYLAKRSLKLHSTRLAAVAEFLGIEGKTLVAPSTWVAAAFGDKNALWYILDHNIRDVIVLEEVHRRLEAFERPVYRSI